MTTVLLAADLHCGHRLGLVPPRWQERGTEAAAIQREEWRALEEALEDIGKIDVGVFAGDLVDGPGARSGSTELIKPPDSEQHRTDKIGLQLEIAEDAIRRFGAQRIEIVCGTPYHVGEGVLQEAILAKRLGAGFHYELNLNVKGVRLNVKHHVGTSQVPHGRATAPLREQSWELIRSAMEQDIAADVIVRAHTHYFQCLQNDAGYVITLPGLQARSRFGTLRLSGRPSLGIVVCRIEGKGDFSVEAHPFKLRSLARKEVRL